MTNNDILKKLRVALQLRDDEIVDILALVDFRISKAEIGAFCRKEGHPKYKECGDQVLRNFLNGLVLHLRGPKEESTQVKGKSVSDTKSKSTGASKPRKSKFTGLGSVPYKNKKGPKKT
ncbi:DUF1456 family protein [Muriicola sp. E247]|uniref:DUF1456 family protein n=1 Tax=unclassified Muriicola TaxID=2647561 RepID=UPI00350EB054